MHFSRLAVARADATSGPPSALVFFYTSFLVYQYWYHVEEQVPSLRILATYNPPLRHFHQYHLRLH